MLTTAKNFQGAIPPTPSLPYTPNEKTLAYYPFRDDLDDQTQSTNLSVNKASLTTDGTIKCLGLSGKKPYALIRSQSPYRPRMREEEIIASMWFYWSGNKTTNLFKIGASGPFVYINPDGELYVKVGNQGGIFSDSNFVAGWNCITCYTCLNSYLDVVTNGFRQGSHATYPNASFTRELYVGGDGRSNDCPPYLNDVIVEYSTDGYFDYSKWITYYNNSKSYYGL